MKRLLFIATIAITSMASAQNNWGFGVRLGDPSGLTLKSIWVIMPWN